MALQSEPPEDISGVPFEVTWLTDIDGHEWALVLVCPYCLGYLCDVTETPPEVSYYVCSCGEIGPITDAAKMWDSRS